MNNILYEFLGEFSRSFEGILAKIYSGILRPFECLEDFSEEFMKKKKQNVTSLLKINACIYALGGRMSGEIIRGISGGICRIILDQFLDASRNFLQKPFKES